MRWWVSGCLWAWDDFKPLSADGWFCVPVSVFAWVRHPVLSTAGSWVELVLPLKLGW